MSDLVGSLWNQIASWVPTKEVHTVVVKEVEKMNLGAAAGKNFIRIAGLSGGLAVIMSAYGAHAFNSKTEDTRLKNPTIAENSGKLVDVFSVNKALFVSYFYVNHIKVFESGNKMHLIHSVALLGVPLTRRPMLVGTLMTSGILIFSGTCYYQAMTGDGRVRKATPYGGILLILSWFAMIL